MVNIKEIVAEGGLEQSCFFAAKMRTPAATNLIQACIGKHTFEDE